MVQQFWVIKGRKSSFRSNWCSLWSFRVLTGVNLFVVVELAETVVSCGHEGTDDWSEPDTSISTSYIQNKKMENLPIDVMVSREIKSSHTRSKSTSRVQSTTSVQHTTQFTDEQGKTDTDRCDGSRFVLLGSKHKDDEDE